MLEAAYNDRAHVTAAFNLNLLQRIRNELDSDIDPSRFVHRAFFNEGESRIEMHLISPEAQDVTIEGRRFHFDVGESLHTENSYKYTLDPCRPGRLRRLRLPRPVDRSARAVQRQLPATALTHDVSITCFVRPRPRHVQPWPPARWLPVSELRIAQLTRCGDLFAENALSWCLNARGLPRADVHLKLSGEALPAEQISRDGNQLRLTLPADQVRSGPPARHDGKRSNPVWLGRSQPGTRRQARRGGAQHG